jgi:hypothetical protein
MVLINVVLTVLSVFFMSAFMLPKRVIHRIDQIRQIFLWYGHKEMHNQQRPIYLANWNLVTRPKEMGGLGVRNLETTNKALMLKWMWNWINDSHH